MKKIFKGFLVFMMIFSFIAKYKALDEREVLTEIVVTSNTSSIPNYKGVIASPVFNITSGSEAHFDTSQHQFINLTINNSCSCFCHRHFLTI